MKSAKVLQNTETEICEPDFTQGDADAKPPITLQEKRSLSFFTLADIPESFSSHWLVKGIIPLSGIGIIYGEYSSGKTFFAIELSMAIARGKDFFGRKVKQKPVLYFCLEGKEGFMNRLAAWKKTHEDWPSNIQFNTADFDFFNKNLNNEINKFPKNSVIIIDTLNATDPTLDENTSYGMGAIIKRAKEIQKITGGLILFIHHCGKDVKKGARGHSSLMAAVDVGILITGKDIRTWRIAKNKDGKADISGNFTLKEIQLGIDEDEEPITSCVIEPCKASKPIEKKLPNKLDAAYKLGIELCTEAGTNEIPTEKWRLKIIENLGKEKSNQRVFFLDAKNRLLDRGLITENGENTVFYKQESKSV